LQTHFTFSKFGWLWLQGGILITQILSPTWFPKMSLLWHSVCTFRMADIVSHNPWYIGKFLFNILTIWGVEFPLKSRFQLSYFLTIVFYSMVPFGCYFFLITFDYYLSLTCIYSGPLHPWPAVSGLGEFTRAANLPAGPWMHWGLNSRPHAC
jgi:hypothetical protein